MASKIDSFRGEFAFLSNFWYASFKHGKRTFMTVEHGYQALKAVDPKERIWVASAPTPLIAKRRGREIVLRKDWESVKLDIMYQLVLAKFVQNEDLAEKLLATGDAILVEGNDWGDRFWGKVDGEGKNHLGKILMQVRKELR